MQRTVRARGRTVLGYCVHNVTLLGSLPSLQIPEAQATRLYHCLGVGSGKHTALHGCRDRRPDQAVKPMVVRLLWSLFPFVYASSSGIGLDEILGGQMLRKHTMCFSVGTEERQAPSIAHGHTHASVDK